jgi:hypothetical protein
MNSEKYTYKTQYTPLSITSKTIYEDNVLRCDVK